jgi:hypothetical protein
MNTSLKINLSECCKASVWGGEGEEQKERENAQGKERGSIE